MQRKLNIVFMGTPEFAVPSLDILLGNNYRVSAVVTAPDKPAGRGKQIRMSAVKHYALKKDLKVLQPEKFKDPAFLEELKASEANLFIIVAFRMLPKEVWDMPEYGSFNLHASLLPNYRGAAPMNWVLINGEKETGLTTFFLNESIDTGDIILQDKVPIGKDVNLEELHDVMMEKGARLVLKTVKSIENGSMESKSQDRLLDENATIKPAPKIFREDCRINWQDKSENIRNFIRGLSPVPGAFTILLSPDANEYQIKLYKSSVILGKNKTGPGAVDTDGSSFLNISTSDGWLGIDELQLSGKKRMKIDEFLRGFDLSKAWTAK